MSDDKPKAKKVKKFNFEDQAAKLFETVDPVYKSKYGGLHRAVFMTLYQFNKMKGNTHLEYDEPGYLVEIKKGQYKWLSKNLFELGRF